MHVTKDMSLNHRLINKQINSYSGLYFTYSDTFIVLIFTTIIAFVLNLYYKFNYLYIIFSTFLFTIYQSSLWNTIPPEIHKTTNNLSIYEGIPSLYLLRKLPFYTWLKNNHIKHHKIKGDKKGNYNITLPFADFLFNTYN